ncbi:hypothetical protein WJX79_008707 [Trebouxia sp. C0005]
MTGAALWRAVTAPLLLGPPECKPLYLSSSSSLTGPPLRSLTRVWMKRALIFKLLMLSSTGLVTTSDRCLRHPLRLLVE